MKKPAPSGEEGSARGPLVWSPDELHDALRGMTFPEPTAEAIAEAELEAKIFRAIESGELGRKKPGRKPGRTIASEAVRAVAQACLNEAGGRPSAAKRAFIKRVCAEKSIGSDHADNLWYEVTEPVGRTNTRRVR